MTNPIRAIVMLGPPGCGKGTQTRALGALPGWMRHSAGEALRRRASSSETTGAGADYAKAGELAPCRIVIDALQRDIRHAVSQGRFDPAAGVLLLDGLPRSTEQARQLDGVVRVQRVVHLECRDRAVLINRLTRRGREDDRDPDTVERRFSVYEEKTKAVLRYYPQEAVGRVDAEQAPHRVLGDITESLRDIEF
ncbi:nucleoside monophosphate kinase [Botrimarina sp.]|uniref:adenylate kinase family protein n=1 Tax=Botrimarina sp. TaxID=2795802 RepID=UPI0032EDB216